MAIGRSALILAVFLGLCALSEASNDESTHTNNWAVIVCASRYWFNYRHVANALSIYRSVKRLGIPDSNIILMLADDMACNPRNPRPATVFNNANQHINVYGDDVEVDYRGYEVTVENFLRVLTGRVNASVPRSKKLLSDDRSNILVYMTGHGGDGFLKFQDAEEISNYELGDAFEQMWQKKRYNELMFLIDTCQAASMFRTFYSPNIVACGSSAVNEDALSHHMDSGIGVHIIDRWTYYALEFLEKVSPASQATVADFFNSFNPELVQSTPQVRSDLLQRKMDKSLLTDFFGSVRNIELLNISSKEEGPGEMDVEEEASSGRDMVAKTAPTALDVPTMVGFTAVELPEVAEGQDTTGTPPVALTALGFFMAGITMATGIGMYGLVTRH